ncbi:hypothetical protein OG474_24580 [Kribbella sp. NBC_01505]|uniref:hypothetical protein n=1 Tax=Kribbella sp. NBC_01505 TaxID=2903580 RepID=UPI00386C6861
MLTLRLTAIGLVATASLGVATALPAFADKGGATPGTSGNMISITVTGTGVVGGSAGQPGRSSVSVPVPCTYIQSMTGKEYYDYIKGGGPLGRDKDGNPFKPNPGYEQYKDDTEGHWYGGMCSSASFDGDLDEFFDFTDKWFADHKAVYVHPGETPPIPPVPVQILRNVAFDAMTIPNPTVNWNPKRAGDAASIVNLDTWFWLDNYPTDLYVEAAVNTMAGEVRARVDATMDGMNISAPNSDGVQCKGAGVPYKAGASTDCSLTFHKASASTPVTITTNWQTTWFGTGHPDPEPTPEQLAPPATTTPVRVLEIQAIGQR